MPEQSRSQDQKQHLYLVFDDWNSGYSIRKVSLSALPSLPGKGARLPSAFMRVSAPRGFPGLFTSAFGSKIIMMHPSGDDYASFTGVPTVDVQNRTMTYETEPNAPAVPIYIPVSDDRLFALDIATFEILLKPDSGQPCEWQNLTHHPFWIGDVSSYCVEPDGCILFSTKKGETFIFDTREYVWNKSGDWVFPFTGRGHYDSSLKGFVGLSKEPETLGFLYCCTMDNTATGLDTGKILPPVKCDKVKVFNKNPAAEGQHVSATLVHMSPGKFCLVECASIGKRMTDQELHQELRRFVPIGADPMDFMGGGPQGDRFMYRLKTFALSYDTKGQLKLKNSKVYRYSLPREARVGTIWKDPVAFWL